MPNKSITKLKNKVTEPYTKENKSKLTKQKGCNEVCMTTGAYDAAADSYEKKT